MATAPIQANTPAPPQAVAAGYTNLVLDDEFNDPSTVGAFGSGAFWTPDGAFGTSGDVAGSTATVANGILTITAGPGGGGSGFNLTTANWSVGDGTPGPYTGYYQYGYYEIRALSTNLTTLWLWSSNPGKWTPAGQPVSPSPSNPSTLFGEIDIQESNQDIANRVNTTIHTNTQSYGGVSDSPTGTAYTASSPVINGWHTYGVLWTPTTLSFYLDGSTTPYFTENYTNLPGGGASLQQPMEILLSAMNPFGTGQWGGTPTQPVITQVDYVHVWQQGTSPTPTPTPPPPPSSAGTSTIVLHVSGDQYLGDPQFTLDVNGQQVGGTYDVTAQHSLNQWQDITVTGSFGSTGPQSVAVNFVNDAYGGSPSTDRNLYVGSIDVNGHVFAGSAATNTASLGVTDPNAADMFINGTATFNTTGSPPPAASAPILSIGNASAAEGGSESFAVTLSQASSISVTVAYTTHDGTAVAGTDYAAASGTLTFAPGQTTQTITVNTLDDHLANEPNETFTVALTNPSNASLGTASGTGSITENDATPMLSMGNASAVEGGVETFAVTLSQASATPVTVAYATHDGAAVAGTDYAAASGTLTFAPGQTTQTITVNTLDDHLANEPNETFTVALTNPSNASLGTASGTGSITENDATPMLSMGNASAVEGGVETFAVTLSQASATPVTVAYATHDGAAVAGTDYTAASGTLTFAPGQTTQTITVNTLDDHLANEPSETFTVALTNPSNASLGTATGIGSITDTDAAATLSIGNASAVEGGVETFAVTLSQASTTPVTVAYTTQDGSAVAGTDYTAASGTLTFAPGQTTQTITVNTLDDHLANEPNETFTVALTNPSNGSLGTAIGTGTIVQGSPASIILHVSGDQWEGDPQFVVLVNGQQVGGTYDVSALHSAGQWQDITIADPVTTGLPQQMQVQFINDAYGGTASTDRNLYVGWTDVNGHQFNGATATSNTASNGVTNPNAADMFVNGTVTFDTSPTSEITLHVSGDSWNGAPQLALLVDGKQVGTASVTASHGAGQWQDVTFAGNFGALGPQQVQVQFTNDAWGGPGTVGEDRNLYVGWIDVNGHQFQGTAATSNTGSAGATNPNAAVLLTNGTVSFGTAGSAPAPYHADALLSPTGSGQRLVGTAHNEMFVGGHNDTLTGGGGQDLFVYRSLADAGGTITDFNPAGDQHSVLDLQPLMNAIGYHGTDPVADHVLSFAAQGTSATAVMVEAPGSTTPVTLVTLQHVVPTAITAADYVWHA